MQLRLIYELNLDRAIQKIGPLLKTLPKRKRKHSHRVARTLHKVGVGKIGVYAGLLHDYLERGGDVETLSTHVGELGLPAEILVAVQSLSNDEKYAEAHPNQPLVHLQNVLGSISDVDLKNIVILIKLSDRLDNLKQRYRRGKIGNNYRRKSAELVQWLAAQYVGKPGFMKKLLRRLQQFI